MRIQGVVLEDHGNVTISWFHRIYPTFTDVESATGDFFQAGNHSQQRTLATTRWPDKGDKFAVHYLEIHAEYGLHVAI